MEIVKTPKELASAVAALKAGGRRLALVPTMGALHEGHLTLVREAAARAERVAASIFVNPLQFGANEDLDRYPRRETEDAAMLAEAGCNLLWMPAASDIYPVGFATTVTVAGVGDRWEGEARPGHFAGVATVVAKLLIATAPDVALFGEKDFQQLAVIRRMVADLGLPVEIAGIPTVRDEDGLALSSRNAYLSAGERQRAVALPRALQQAKQRIREGGKVLAALAEAKTTLTQADFAPIDYLALVDAATLEPLDEPGGEMRLIAAAWMGKTRLIDNISV